MIMAVFVRRLREGQTYDDFRKAWYPDFSFPVKGHVVTGMRLDDPREIINIGFMDISPEDFAGFLEGGAPHEATRHDRIADVIEPEMTRTFYVQIADDDFSDRPVG
jgi:hypothetical protein